MLAMTLIAAIDHELTLWGRIRTESTIPHIAESLCGDKNYAIAVREREHIPGTYVELELWVWGTEKIPLVFSVQVLPQFSGVDLELSKELHGRESKVDHGRMIKILAEIDGIIMTPVVSYDGGWRTFESEEEQ
jgi:hypothetical protein